ncbi:hypothetical protein [Deinococcus aquaticus]|uniref:DNA polymerase III subunit epsilon n=1 Tax=Deinococcus aquaticus TaxID=328692 RepID=A0ABY7V792_9DEIO|nr:hypothetical protein [Deinococcus aquaticus]WDA60741.1 hypothetical protein M8445_17385 [Deinococcus aquaticus]
MTTPALPDAAIYRAHRADRKIRELADSPNLRVLEISTNNLGGVPIAAVVLDGQGAVLYETLIRTDLPIDDGAQAVHGISASMLLGEPSFAEAHEILGQLLVPGLDVLVWAAPFIQASLNRGAAAEGLPRLPFRHWQPGLQILVTEAHGTYSHRRFDFLDVSRRKALEGVTLPADVAPEGTALGNAQRTLAMLRHYAVGRVAVQEPERIVELNCPGCGAPESLCECDGKGRA